AYECIPTLVCEATKQYLLDTIGSDIDGSQTSWAKILHSLFCRWFQSDRPPSTTYTAPVTYAAREAKKVTTSATPSGAPARPRGISASICSIFLEVRAAVMSVRTYPGMTTFAVMPYGATSLASERVKPIRPALAAPYAVSPGQPTSPTTEEILIMRPLRHSIMCGTTCWQQWYAPFRHESITASQSLSGSLCTRRPRCSVALCTSTSIWPKRSSTCATMRCTSAATATSACTGKLSRPKAPMASCTATAASGRLT